jgi:hypothetical protein
MNLQFLKFFKREPGFFNNSKQGTFWDIDTRVIGNYRSSFRNRIVPDLVTSLCLPIKHETCDLYFRITSRADNGEIFVIALYRHADRYLDIFNHFS